MILTTHLVISYINLISLQEETLLYFKVSERKAFPICDNGVQSSDGVTTEEEILKEVIGDDDDDLDEYKVEENLEIVDKSFQCTTGLRLCQT